MLSSPFHRSPSRYHALHNLLAVYLSPPHIVCVLAAEERDAVVGSTLQGVKFGTDAARRAPFYHSIMSIV